jgi:hypothetical protein
MEQLRPQVKARALRSLELSRRPDFVRRMVAFIFAMDIRVVRIHVGGDFYSAAYARKWLEIMRRLPGVRFFLFFRCWRVPAILPVLEAMARQKTCRVWFSCDRQTGIPVSVPPRVRLAWLQTAEDDVPPRADVVFRVRRLRRKPAKRVSLALVCPVENGVTGHRTSCEQCGVCWR